MSDLATHIDRAIDRIEVWEGLQDQSVQHETKKSRLEILLIWLAIGFSIGFVSILLSGR